MSSSESESLLQECTTCGALLDIASEEPFAMVHCPTCGGAMRVRTKLDHFEIQEKVGQGGMGTVFRALDQNLHRSVALKLLQTEHSGNPEFVIQFQKEAAITASINHPHVVKVYSTGRDRERVYIAMELVEMGSLESLMHAQGKVAELQVLTIGVQIAQGLQAALEKGLIHRDIKPGNILFANAATAKIVDFGLAVLAAHADTVAGEVWATPYYVSPETVESRPEDFRSDMYSLGATLFHAIAGTPPHDLETNSMSELARAKKAPVDLQKSAPGVSPTTAFVLNKALSHDPNKRHQSYKELIEQLEFARTELLAKLAGAEEKQRVADAVIARNWSWLTPVVAAVVVILGVAGFQFRAQLFPTESVEAEEAPSTPERIDARYQEARHLLVSGETVKAADVFGKLDADTTAPQPLRNWITLHAGLADLLAGRAEAATAHFAEIEKRGIYSPDPAERDLAEFFVATARFASSKTPIKLKAVQDIDRDSFEAIGLFVAGVRNWSLGSYDLAWQFFRQYSRCTPSGRHAWASEYKALASPFLVEISAWRAATGAAKAAQTIDARRRALQVTQDSRSQIRLTTDLAKRLDTLAADLQKQVKEEEDVQAELMSATEAADAKALADASNKIGPLRLQFRFTEALVIARAVKVTGEKGQQELAATQHRLEWLARFKITLTYDINTQGYPSAVLKKSGTQVPGPIKRANEMQIETVTPFGTLPTLWTDLPPESVITMAKSFLRADLPAATLADRQWLIGVYAQQAGRLKEGHDLLIQASQVKEEYREALGSILENSEGL